ncbi:MAG: hypothetical protein KF784_06880 [Fimbriimonadaceae bacterium]|nr:hypothetical protein [Fimbriimonadaceae bacterium]
MRGLFSMGMLAALAVIPFIGSAFVSADKTSPVQVEYAAAPKSLGDPIPGLTTEEEDLAIRGLYLFRWDLWRNDASAKGFNGRNCVTCHIEPYYGGGSRKIDDAVAFKQSETDPTGWELVHKFVRSSSGRFERTPPPEDAELRRAPMLFGGGLLETVTSQTLTAMADPEDKNGDGISGRVHAIGTDIGRFGWKSSAANLDTFVVTAFKNEIGMVVQPFNQRDFTGLGSGQIKAVVHYLRTLGPPPRPQLDAESEKGKKLFSQIGCDSCHKPELRTGTSPIKAISQKTIQVYSDLLLHDVVTKIKASQKQSPELHVVPKQIGVGEYRTPPLWGLGLWEGPFWHDGSAATIEQAISFHQGEATESRKRYEQLSKPDQDRLIGFLKKL